MSAAPGTPNALGGRGLGTPPSAPDVVVARRDPALSARVLGARPLRYAAGADPAQDRPAYVRSGSGLAWVPSPAGPRLAVVQDDAHFLALVDPATGLADAVPLPRGSDGRRLFGARLGNKLQKLDLEACLTVSDPADGTALLLAFGSGATPERQRVAVVRGLAAGTASAEVTVADASALYLALLVQPDFAGAELNVEGAACVATPAGPVVRLFARGNGLGNALAGAADAAAGAAPANATSATCDLPLDALLAHLLGTAPAPPPARVTRYDLGTLGGERLGFTDATPLGGGVLYLAAAERSADVLDDGPVTGSAVGRIAADGSARWAPLTGPAGEPFPRKAEGVAPAGPGRLWVVLDEDDPDAPALLCDVALGGPGWR